MAAPKSLARIKRDPRVTDAWDEGDDGYWADLAPGYVSADDTTTLHEHTIKDLRAALAMVRRREDEA